MAHKKGGGSSRNGRDSNAQHLGVKVFGGQTVPAGASSILGVAVQRDDSTGDAALRLDGRVLAQIDTRRGPGLRSGPRYRRARR